TSLGTNKVKYRVKKRARPRTLEDARPLPSALGGKLGTRFLAELGIGPDDDLRERVLDGLRAIRAESVGVRDLALEDRTLLILDERDGRASLAVFDACDCVTVLQCVPFVAGRPPLPVGWRPLSLPARRRGPLLSGSVKNGPRRREGSRGA